MLDYKEKQKRILDAFNLKVGNKIKFIDNNFNKTYKVENRIYKVETDCLSAVNHNQCLGFEKLYYLDWEKVEPEKITVKKKLGEFTCRQIHCHECPLHDLFVPNFCVCEGDTWDSLFTSFELTKAAISKPKYVTIDWDAIKTELDKEVEREVFD